MLGQTPMKFCNIEVYSATSIISLEAGKTIQNFEFFLPRDFCSVYPAGNDHMLPAKGEKENHVEKIPWVGICWFSGG